MAYTEHGAVGTKKIHPFRVVDVTKSACADADCAANGITATCELGQILSGNWLKSGRRSVRHDGSGVWTLAAPESVTAHALVGPALEIVETARGVRFAKTALQQIQASRKHGLSLF